MIFPPPPTINIRAARLGAGLALALALTGCVVVPPPVESPYNRGVQLYDEGKYAEAIEQYKLALERRPEDRFAAYNLAVAYQDMGRAAEAESWYRKVLERGEDTRSRVNLAALYMTQGKEEQAYEELRVAARNNSDNPHPAAVLGEYLERKGRADEAEKCFQEALRIDGKHAGAHSGLGRLLVKREQWEEGERHLLAAIEAEPRQPAFMEALAGEYQRRNRNKDAIALLERVAALQEDRAEIFSRLGDLYREERVYDLAIMRYWTALAIDGQDMAARHHLLEALKALMDQERKKLEELQNRRTVATRPQ